ncbi:MAG: transcription-repair coupling factor [Planctomycetes bacterium]|nr:transcription-repair coupling factor [Planctomycetota bacterium]MCB9889645.1 transcription-repair coupling factor [Planctomycetota bacterium]
MLVVRGFEGLSATERVSEALRQRTSRAIGGLWGASSGLLLHVLQRQARSAMLVITADDDESQALAGDIAAFRGADCPTPPARVLITELTDLDGQVDPVTRSQRVQTLTALRDEQFLLLCSLAALLQPAPAPRSLRRGRLELRTGAELDPQKLFERAVAAGMTRVPVVLAPGELSLRGDVLDLFPLGAVHPLRLEVFDGCLESIRWFDPAEQRSLRVLDAVELDLATSRAEAEVLDHVLRRDLVVLRHEPLRLEERSLQLMSQGDATDRALQRFRDATAGLPVFQLSSLPGNDIDYRILSAGSAVGSGETDPRGRLATIRGPRGHVRIVCATEDDHTRLAQIFAHQGIDPEQQDISFAVGSLTRGFRIPDAGITVVSNTEFAGVPSKPRVREKTAIPSRALASFFELGPGDIVVHAVHGIARFDGIELVKRGTAAEDHLRLSFRDEVTLLVPASKVHLVQKYVGSGDAAPKLDKLGGKSFAKRKAEVEQALFDMAADLLDVQIRRETLERPPYPSDPLEDEFLDGFPFTDTADQARAWTEIRGDLEGPRPMDRLLCGDVGFGKTEVAMRAAFKVAITGRQVAVLVPTTILAEQHAANFAARFAPHGLTVEVLSRFRKPKDVRRVLADTAAGRVDTLIGTHRLLGEDVRFRDLGLMVVDEEQRFGVRQKEQIKQRRGSVDVLTLSATPIPRTLHASLVGIRDISTLTEPPPGRQDVETRMAFHDASVVQQALQRELQRGGQVFVLHNRVESIEQAAAQIRRLAPQARVVVGHGQMTEREMEAALRTFLHGDADILVCTTIVENGIDLPRANTILIERADRFGLAELHQLRGRVGRSSNQAHCLLLLDRATPISTEARKRLKALEEFSTLGAGFAIAMKDLEIRGAGNLLGPQQSGHIAAVGYEMYCRLMSAAMDRARDGTITAEVQRYEVREVDVDLRLEAFLPEEFVADPKQRLELLREMDGAVDPRGAAAIGGSIADRFGALPGPTQNLLATFLLKHLLLDHGVLGIHLVDGERLVVRHPPGVPLGGAWLDRFRAVRQVEPGKTHLMLPTMPLPRGTGATPEVLGPHVLRLLLESLLGTDPLPMMAEAWDGPTHRRPRGPRP